ncbi:RICIN domain-containing protein [Streptomyces sp. NPDC059917]|uniref:RICIN domain-containing protein n=1 Tax=Streptomyces sp. NPDC059917 TaxID=3347002 RepID=UPI00366662EE
MSLATAAAIALAVPLAGTAPAAAQTRENPGNSERCAYLKKAMDRIGLPINPSLGGSLAYVILYAEAKSLGCDFVNTPAYHVDPTQGHEGALHVQGNPVPADRPAVAFNGYDPMSRLYRDQRPDGMMFLPTDQANRYLLTITTGSQAGKCLNSYWAGDKYGLVATTCGNSSDRWSLKEAHGNGWSAWVVDNFSSTGEHHGVLDVPGGRTNEKMIVYPWNNGWNQLFNFRPMDFKP